MDWVHCNNCFFLPGQGKQFFLTSCGHIYCADCKTACTTEVCKLCSNSCTSVILSSQMRPDVEMYFSEPVELLKKYIQTVKQVSEFQQNHRNRLMAFYKNFPDQLNTIKQEYRKVITKFKEVSQEKQRYKKELDRLQKMIGCLDMSSSYGEQSNSRKFFVSPPHSTPASINERVIPRSKGNLLNLQRFYSPLDPVIQTPQSSRVLIRSPPENGTIPKNLSSARTSRFPGQQTFKEASRCSDSMSRLHLTNLTNSNNASLGTPNSNNNSHRGSSVYSTPDSEPYFKSPDEIIGRFGHPERRLRSSAELRRAAIHPYSPADD